MIIAICLFENVYVFKKVEVVQLFNKKLTVFKTELELELNVSLRELELQLQVK